MLPLRQISWISETICVLLIFSVANHQNAVNFIKHSSVVITGSSRRRNSNDRIRGGASLLCLRGLHAAWTSAASSGSAATGPPPPRADAREVHGAHLRRRQDRRRGRACVPRPGVMHRDPQAREVPVRGQEPRRTTQGHRLRPLRLLQTRSECSLTQDPLQPVIRMLAPVLHGCT